MSNWLFLLALLLSAIFVLYLERIILPDYKILLFGIYFVSVLFGSFFISYSIAKTITDPLKLIEKRTNEINAGDFGTALTASEIEELANLSESINTMSRRLKLQFTDLSIEKEKFNSLLQNLKEGVFAINPEQKILFQNKSIPSDLIPPNSNSRPIFKVVKNPAFHDFLKRNISNQTDEKIEIEIEDRFYNIRFYHLKSNDKIIISIGIVRDKTEERHTQIIREQFAQNASHELKSPITSIKGYAETLSQKLQSQPDSQERKFLDAILRNTDRMVRIVDDMLLITKMENYETIFQPEKFYLNDLIEDIKLTVDGFIKLKNQTFVVNIPGKMEIFADMVLLEHLLLNLLQNASAYSPENKKIELKAFYEKNSVLIQVIDEGIGISSEFKQRIFERFFRVDTNRSRKEGGTGLGLSIVKHVAKIHKGWVDVNPNVGNGSVFTVSIPL